MTAPDSPLLAYCDGGARVARFTVRPPPARELELVAGVLAGAAEMDITPPPGMPKAGYSANAHTGRGFRTRLRARVLHLRAGAASIAIVQCDLLAGSALVQHLVAQAVSATTDVPLSGLFIGATHTHAAPGQYFGTEFYNRFASNRAGLDPAWTQFLVEQIATGVRDAVATRRPARLAWGSTGVWGLTRNRSLAPHVHNAEISDKRTEPQRKFIAINPWLHLLRVDTVSSGGGTEPLAALVVFSVHGTGISMHAYDYNADVWAYLVGELGARIEAAYGKRAVVGAIQGTHADVAPALRPGLAGHLEAGRIGRRIGAAAAALFTDLEPSLSQDVPLGAGLREVDLDRGRSIDGIALARRPLVGAALVAGATENTTPVLRHVPPFRPGVPKPGSGSRFVDAKWAIASRWLQPLLLPTRTFPRVLPVQVLRVGEVALLGLPFEITVATGQRIASHAARRGLRVVMSSVANEYVGYATTPEEYALQYYEGGHTLYGPRTSSWLAAQSARLVGEVAARGIVCDVCPARHFDLPLGRYLVRTAGAGVARRAGAAVAFHDPSPLEDANWEFRWRDVAPGGLHWHEPIVRVDASSDGKHWSAARREGRIIDDQGWDLEVRHLRAAPEGNGTHHYAAYWWDPELRAELMHRFVLVANNGQPELCSAPFD